MKKVLIITYYWPPSGGSGVQRWLKFVKYLPAYQWEPHVFTPENPSFAVRDPSLEKDVPPEAEVIRFPIWEPYDLFFRISGWFGAKKTGTPAALVPSGKKTVFQYISTWIRGNFFIPDPRRFWIKPSVKFLTDYIADNKIETVITTGPPHSVHLIGLRLKSKYPTLRWLADFRDPWTEWGMWDSLLVGAWARNVHKRMERRVLASADEIITITPFYARRFEQLARRPVRLLTNGFDEEDFRSLVHSRPDKFTIRHVGTINDKCDPRPFLGALKEQMEEDAAFGGDVRVEFIGEIHPEFRRYVSQSPVLEKVVSLPGSVPHEQLIPLYGSSSVLLLILTGYKDAQGFLPGKLFEYFAAGLPVLGIGPSDGDAADLLRETGAGVMVESGDVSGIKSALAGAYSKWCQNKETVIDLKYVQRYSRKAITGQLSSILALPGRE